MKIYSKLDLYNNILYSDEATVISCLEEKDESYNHFEIPKKNGVRSICAINKENMLYRIQSNLNRNFVANIPLPVCVKGFVKGESFRSFLEVHQGNEFFLRIDLKDFFGSITKKHIEIMLRDKVKITDKADYNDVIKVIVQICTLNDILPQGAVTSPGISNLVFARLDQRILKYCQLFNIEYTRYADDMLFSSLDFDFDDKKWFLKKIRHILSSQQFYLNYSKKQSAKKAISLNGFVISDSIRLSRKRFKDISLSITSAKKSLIILENHGEDSFVKELNTVELVYRDLKQYPFNSLSQFIQFLSGYRSYFISWTDNYFYYTPGQKKLRRTIRRIEGLIQQIENITI